MDQRVEVFRHSRGVADRAWFPLLGKGAGDNAEWASGLE